MKLIEHNILHIKYLLERALGQSVKGKCSAMHVVAVYLTQCICTTAVNVIHFHEVFFHH